MPSPENTRETLLLKLRDQADQAAWEEFAALYRPYLYRVAQNLGVSPDEREDLIQDVMIAAWKQLPSFDYDQQRGKFRGWLCLITKRRAIAMRKKSVKHAGNGAEALPKIDAFSIDSELEAISKKEWERHVSEVAWQRISPRFKPKVLTAFKALAEGKKGEAVASELGLSINSVYVYKKRVLAALHKEIAYLD